MPTIWLVLAVIAQVAALSVTTGSGWSYEGDDGPATWSATYPACGGREQSPVDLNTCTNQSFANFSGSVVGVVPSVVNVTLLNSGHTLTVTPPSIVTVAGGGLNETYTLAAVHFHWGNASDRGSEHTVSGKRFPMEVHMVTYKSIYANLNAALNTSDREAVSVLGVFVQVKGNVSTTSAVDTLVSVLPNITNPGSSIALSLPMTGLAQAFQSIIANSGFYRYLGSLTTPGCDQKVKWTVFQDTLGVTENQLNAFRQLNSSHGSPLVDNYRPTQDINNRMVYCSSRSAGQSLSGAASILGHGFGLVPLVALTAVALLLAPLSPSAFR